MKGGEVVLKLPHSISVFNRYDENGEEILVRKELHGVLFESIDAASRGRLGLSPADTATVYIPRRVYSDEYVDEYTWLHGDAEFKAAHLTFRKGDYVAKGIVSLEGVDINDYKNDNGNLYEITEVTHRDYGGLQHIFLTLG